MLVPDSLNVDWQLTVLGQLANEGAGVIKCYNNFHLRRVVVTVPVIKAQLVAGFATPWSPVLALLSADYTAVTVLVRCLNDATDPEEAVTVSYAGGGGSGDRLPARSSLCMSWRTALRGRNYLGKTHISGVLEADTTGDVLEPVTAKPAWTAAMSLLRATFNGGDGNSFQLSVFSRNLSVFATNPTDIKNNVVTTGLLQTRIGQMKHRRGTGTIVAA